MTEREERILLYGEDYVLKEEQINSRFKDISDKYEYWFINRPGLNENEKHDDLYNHIILLHQNQQWKLVKREESDLPNDIWMDCVAAFREVVNI